MIELNLGCNFDELLISKSIELNDCFKKNGIVIKEFFGSDKRHAYLSARPEFRLQNIGCKRLERYIKMCNDAGIEFNYTLNGINPGSKQFLLDKKQEIFNFIKYLKAIGVKRVTVSNVLVMSFVKEAEPDLPIEASTIMHIDTISQIKWLSDHFHIDKICGSILKNRNILFLKKAADFCKEIGIKYEILVNEFCGNGGSKGMKAYGTSCILRDHCYILHSSNITKKNAELFNTYPMGYCMNSRMDPSSWLKMRFVLPQDIDQYGSIGINNFKISGRTGTTDYLLQVVEAYLSKNWSGNLLALWKQLETIYSKQKETEFDFPYNISCKKLTENNFVSFWFENKNHRCEEENCGVTCQYCNIMYKKIKD